MVVAEDYWMALDEETDSIISASCPSSICCQLSAGCDYVENADSLCASNRDSNSLLCSRCIEGYSESMNSENCTKCDKNVHWEYLLFPLCMTLLLSMSLLFSNREDSEEPTESNVQTEDTKNDESGSSTKTALENVKRLKDSEAKITLPSLAKIAVLRSIPNISSFLLRFQLNSSEMFFRF